MHNDGSLAGGARSVLILATKHDASMVFQSTGILQEKKLICVIAKLKK